MYIKSGLGRFYLENIHMKKIVVVCRWFGRYSPRTENQPNVKQET